MVENTSEAPNELKETAEEIGGPFGFKLVWRYTPDAASFEAWQVVARDSGPLALARFVKQGATIEDALTDSMLTYNVSEAELFLTGAITADERACFRGCPAVKGGNGLRMLLALEKYAFGRAFDFMGRSCPL